MPYVSSDSSEYIFSSSRQKAKKICYFCNKVLSEKIYKVMLKWGAKKRVCSNCKYIYDLLEAEVMNDNLEGVNGIYLLLKTDYNIDITILSWQKTVRRGKFVKPSTMKKRGIRTNTAVDKLARMRNKCCRFCEKQFRGTYTLITTKLRKPNTIFRICRNCEYLIKLMLAERNSHKLSVIGNMIGILAWRKKSIKERVRNNG